MKTLSVPTGLSIVVALSLTGAAIGGLFGLPWMNDGSTPDMSDLVCGPPLAWAAYNLYNWGKK